jgi:hypothetical protein
MAPCMQACECSGKPLAQIIKVHSERFMAAKDHVIMTTVHGAVRMNAYGFFQPPFDAIALDGIAAFFRYRETKPRGAIRGAIGKHGDGKTAAMSAAPAV